MRRGEYAERQAVLCRGKPKLADMALAYAQLKAIRCSSQWLKPGPTSSAALARPERRCVSGYIERGSRPRSGEINRDHMLSTAMDSEKAGDLMEESLGT
jgi:hypothetical protein